MKTIKWNSNDVFEAHVWVSSYLSRHNMMILHYYIGFWLWRIIQPANFTPVVRHFVFYFAKSVLIPHLLRHPGQLTFNCMQTMAVVKTRTALFCGTVLHYTVARELKVIKYHLFRFSHQDPGTVELKALSGYVESNGFAFWSAIKLSVM